MYTRPYKTTEDDTRPYMTTRGHIRPQEAILGSRGHTPPHDEVEPNLKKTHHRNGI